MTIASRLSLGPLSSRNGSNAGEILASVFMLAGLRFGPLVVVFFLETSSSLFALFELQSPALRSRPTSSGRELHDLFLSFPTHAQGGLFAAFPSQVRFAMLLVDVLLVFVLTRQILAKLFCPVGGVSYYVLQENQLPNYHSDYSCSLK